MLLGTNRNITRATYCSQSTEAMWWVHRWLYTVYTVFWPKPKRKRSICYQELLILLSVMGGWHWASGTPRVGYTLDGSTVHHGLTHRDKTTCQAWIHTQPAGLYPGPSCSDATVLTTAPLCTKKMNGTGLKTLRRLHLCDIGILCSDMRHMRTHSREGVT